MKNIIKAAIFLFLIYMTLSCSVAHDNMPEKPIRFHQDFSKNGLIFGSITFPNQEANFNSYFIRISCIDETDNIKSVKNFTEIHIKPEYNSNIRHIGHYDNGRTYVFALERLPGKYEIPSVRLFRNSGIVYLQRTDYVGEFTIPFEVKKGEINYIGNIIFNDKTLSNDTIVKHQNNFDKDVKVLKNIQPTVNWNLAKNDTLIKIKYNNKNAKL
jgi:hypothetical protein